MTLLTLKVTGYKNKHTLLTLFETANHCFWPLHQLYVFSTNELVWEHAHVTRGHQGAALKGRKCRFELSGTPSVLMTGMEAQDTWDCERMLVILSDVVHTHTLRWGSVKRFLHLVSWICGDVEWPSCNPMLFTVCFQEHEDWTVLVWKTFRSTSFPL